MRASTRVRRRAAVSVLGVASLALLAAGCVSTSWRHPQQRRPYGYSLPYGHRGYGYGPTRPYHGYYGYYGYYGPGVAYPYPVYVPVYRDRDWHDRDHRHDGRRDHVWDGPEPGRADRRWDGPDTHPGRWKAQPERRRRGERRGDSLAESGDPELAEPLPESRGGAPPRRRRHR